MPTRFQERFEQVQEHLQKTAFYWLISFDVKKFYVKGSRSVPLVASKFLTVTYGLDEFFLIRTLVRGLG